MLEGPRADKQGAPAFSCAMLASRKTSPPNQKIAMGNGGGRCSSAFCLLHSNMHSLQIGRCCSHCCVPKARMLCRDGAASGPTTCQQSIETAACWGSVWRPDNSCPSKWKLPFPAFSSRIRGYVWRPQPSRSAAANISAISLSVLLMSFPVLQKLHAFTHTAHLKSSRARRLPQQSSMNWCEHLLHGAVHALGCRSQVVEDPWFGSCDSNCKVCSIKMPGVLQ